MPKTVHFDKVINTLKLWPNSVARQVTFNSKKLMENAQKPKKSNATFRGNFSNIHGV